jgi:hypothetical protein
MCCKESVGYIKLQKGMEEEEKWVWVWDNVKDLVEGGDRERKMVSKIWCCGRVIWDVHVTSIGNGGGDSARSQMTHL